MANGVYYLLNKIQSVVIKYKFSHVLIMGDFNRHIRTNFFYELMSFIIDNNYKLSDVEFLGLDSNTTTYYGKANDNARWLDDVVTSCHVNENIKNIKVLDYFIITDHRPIQVCFNYDFITSKNIIYIGVNFKINYNWESINGEEINIIYNKSVISKYQIQSYN